MRFVYRGLHAALERHSVTDAEVEQHLQRLLQQNPRITPVTDRPTRSGDEILLDYAGFCGEEQFAGGTAQNQTLVLGSGMFIPGFEEQLLDKMPGSAVTVNVTFPENYGAAELAGKAARFECYIHQIREKTPYEADDTFAKEVGGCDTIEQMRAKLEESLQAYADQRGEMDLQDRLLRQAADTLEFAPSEEQIQAELDNQMQNLAAQLARQGLSMEMYCSFLNTTEDALRQDGYATAAQSIRCRAAIEQIIALEKLTATEAEIEQAVDMVCRQNNMTREQLQPYDDALFRQAVTDSVLAGKVMALIREHAIIEP